MYFSGTGYNVSFFLSLAKSLSVLSCKNLWSYFHWSFCCCCFSSLYFIYLYSDLYFLPSADFELNSFSSSLKCKVRLFIWDPFFLNVSIYHCKVPSLELLLLNLVIFGMFCFHLCLFQETLFLFDFFFNPLVVQECAV